MDKTMNILLIGAPGSGKGTLSQKLTEKFGFQHLSTGDLFRAEIARGTERGKIIDAAISKGFLAPSDILLEVMKDQLSQERYQDNVLLDGFGKTLEEAIELDSFYNIDKVIYLDVDYENLLGRILRRRICPDCGNVTTVDASGEICGKCGSKLVIRSDDKEDVFANRFKVFTEKTLPIVDYFDNKGVLTRIDANEGIDENFAKVCRAIYRDKIQEIER